MAEKKGLKEFMEDLVKDNNLAEKFKDVADPDKVAELAEEEGYYFTAQEYEDLAMAAVNGGFGWNDLKSFAGKVWDGLDKIPDYKKKLDGVVEQGKDIYNQGKDIYNNL